MRLYRKLEELPSLPPCALTIGNFDGVHLGHRALLKAASASGHPVVLTFSNHPASILKGSSPPLLTSESHKLLLLEQLGVEELLLLPFSEELSQLSARAFFSTLKSDLPFTHLICGYDARFGVKRGGTPEEVAKIGQELGFTPTYLPPLRVKEEVVSSRGIRECVEKGELAKAESLLGRPYGFYGSVLPGAGLGRLLGFRTANLSVDGLCLPPCGVYSVEVKTPNPYLGLLNLGYAPTLHANRGLLAEVHLLECSEELYGRQIEVGFKRFIRPEKQFTSAEELRHQILLDLDKV